MRETEPGIESLSRQEAAEQLIDVAYTLVTGGELRLNGDRQVRVPTVDEIVLRRNSKTDGDRFEFGLELSWSTTKAPT